MSIIPFAYEGHEVRFLADENGTPEVVAADIAAVLEYRMASDMTRSIDADEVGTRPVRTPSGMQLMTVLTESGMYQAILQRQTGRLADTTQKAAVKTFQRWVTHEVLPSIRKHGMYATPDAVEKMLADPDVLIGALTELKTERAKRAELEVQAEIMGPKAEYVDTYVACEDLRILRNVAKDCGLPEGVLRDLLIEHGWIYRETQERWSNSKGCKEDEYRYSPYAEKRPYFRMIVNHDAPRFKGELMHTLKVTPAGALAISRAVKRWTTDGEKAA